MNRQECHLLDKSWFGEGIGETWKSGDRASKEMGYDALGCSSEKQPVVNHIFKLHEIGSFHFCLLTLFIPPFFS